MKSAIEGEGGAEGGGSATPDRRNPCTNNNKVNPINYGGYDFTVSH